MISIAVFLNGEGIISSCKASGHARSAPSGGDVVCAAVSVLLRTFVRTMRSCAEISVDFSAPERGEFSFSCDYSPAGREFLRIAGIFLIEGLRSVTEEYREYCSLLIERT